MPRLSLEQRNQVLGLLAVVISQNEAARRSQQFLGRGYPRTSKGQYGAGGYPLPMSPNNISPDSVQTQGPPGPQGPGMPPQPRQASPSYSQPSGLKDTFGQSSLTAPSSSMASPQYSQQQNKQRGLPGMGSRNLDLGAKLFDT